MLKPVGIQAQCRSLLTEERLLSRLHLLVGLARVQGADIVHLHILNSVHVVGLYGLDFIWHGSGGLRLLLLLPHHLDGTGSRPALWHGLLPSLLGLLILLLLSLLLDRTGCLVGDGGFTIRRGILSGSGRYRCRTQRLRGLLCMAFLVVLQEIV